MSLAYPYPDAHPAGYEWFDNEVPFDPALHLELTMPTDIVLLEDLGYDEATIARKATPVAASSGFRMLSDEGAEVMLETARRLRAFCRPAGDRTERSTRGGAYRSRWLHDLSVSPEVTEHMASIYGCAVAPHPMAVHLAHLNYDPSELQVSVDKWHHDTLPLDYVMMVTDPNEVAGGEFEFFLGTRDEAAALAAEGEVPPPERTVRPEFGGAGWAIALHGDMVVHRAAPLNELCERITMVNGYISLDHSLDEQNRSRDLVAVDDHQLLFTDWARFVSWRAKGRLEQLMGDLPYGADREDIIAQLENAVVDVQTAIGEMREMKGDVSHYGGD